MVTVYYYDKYDIQSNKTVRSHAPGDARHNSGDSR
jgi:hypothetical protein